MKETIQKILNIAVWAPSADNSQPWRFEFTEPVLDIFCLPEKDNEICNYRFRGTYIACGALIENIVIAASDFGLGCEVKILSNPEDPKHVATIRLFYSNLPRDPLVDFIKKRASNRKKYKSVPLPEKELSSLKKVAQHFSNLGLQFVEDKKKMKALGKALGMNEIVMLEHKGLHDLFYNDIRWTTRSERKNKTGLYLKTMELELPKLVIFKLLQWWPVAKALNSIGLARFIAKENAKLYGNGSALGFITAPDKDESFVEAGRLLQRVWLQATSLGLNLHLVAGIVFLAQLVNANKAQQFSEEHIGIIKEAQSLILTNIEKSNGIVALCFRIGYGKPPSGTQSRLEPVLIFK